MRITLQIEGGIAHFPGLARPRVLDTTSLPEADAKAVEELVDKAALFSRPAAAKPTGADQRSYEISVERDGEKRVLRVYDPLGPELGALIARLRK